MGIFKHEHEHEQPGAPRQPTDAEIAHARQLLANERNAILDAGHALPVYSAFVEDDNGIRFLLRSYERTRHGRWLTWRMRLARWLSWPPLAAVKFVVVDSKAPDPALFVTALASKVPPSAIPRVQAAYNHVRRQRGDIQRTLEPNGPHDGPKAFYSFEVIAVHLTVERVSTHMAADGSQQRKHVGDGYVPLDLARLRGFSALRPRSEEL